MLNLSVSGALIRDVVGEQLPLLPTTPDLVTCGIGANDILYSAPGKLFSDMRALLAAVPDDTVMLDLPLLAGFWWIVGRMSVPYITRINRVIHEVATEREPAGRRGVRAVHPAVDRQVRLRQLPPQPGRLPRLDPRPPRRPPGRLISPGATAAVSRVANSLRCAIPRDIHPE